MPQSLSQQGLKAVTPSVLSTHTKTIFLSSIFIIVSVKFPPKIKKLCYDFYCSPEDEHFSFSTTLNLN